MPDSNFQSTGNVLKKILKEYQLESSLFNEKLFNSWPEIVGEKLAKICQPVYFNEGILTIKVKDQIWREELGKNQKELLNSIKTKTKVNKIDHIEFI